MTVKELRKMLLREKSTFVISGDCFSMSQYMGIGYGNSVGTRAMSNSG
jgi:hypothetical protein